MPDRAVDDGRGLLVIRDIRITDAGKYICQATDGVSIFEDSYTLNVEGKRKRPSFPNITTNQFYMLRNNRSFIRSLEQKR